MTILNPATEEVIRDVVEDTHSSIQGKFDALRQGQHAWSAKSLELRVENIRNFCSALERDRSSLAAILTSEVGKPLAQSVNEINGACKRITWLADHAVAFLSDEWMSQSLEKIVYEPLGVVANISAWNYPYNVGVNVFIPALLAGNAVLYKPSEFATLTGLAIREHFAEVGIGPDVFDMVVGGPMVGKELLKLHMDGYFFTGSYKTGKSIYEAVAPKMVPCQCELGGKDPLYVADDVADVSKVAEATADGAFYNNGQSCCSVERIYVHERIYEKYVAAFVNSVKEWKIGLPTEEGVYFGPLTRKAQLDLLEAQVKDAVSMGARILLGGKRIVRKGYYFEPTILVDVDNSMRVMREESFGPIIGIMKVKTDDEAVHLMADTEYGLTASVYSSDQGRAMAILAKLNTGSAYWNCCDRVSPSLPWSGRQHSGFGATLSHAGLRAFTHTKSYHLQQPA